MIPMFFSRNLRVEKAYQLSSLYLYANPLDAIEVRDNKHTRRHVFSRMLTDASTRMSNIYPNDHSFRFEATSNLISSPTVIGKLYVSIRDGDKWVYQTAPVLDHLRIFAARFHETLTGGMMSRGRFLEMMAMEVIFMEYLIKRTGDANMLSSGPVGQFLRRHMCADAIPLYQVDEIIPGLCAGSDLRVSVHNANRRVFQLLADCATQSRSGPARRHRLRDRHARDCTDVL
ncbi:hypothetical protein THOM_2784 [Trachipleistophora hominis]|uniref:Uncharacterized protein n=1 Tax=Trachipleistophora hominis TaxID=72359 RepID=L7JSM5_TRAHO|nr:hypothetical protein THOM_2784 [Trachipleistophora hominis]